jgi:hypothetical protein
MHRKLISLAAVAIAVAAVSGLGYAAIPSSSGVISACKDNKGALKVIDAEAGATCPGSQQLLEWGKQGPQGPPGIGSPQAFAFIAADGKVDAGNSKGIEQVNVTKPPRPIGYTHGHYCIDGLAFQPKVVLVTLGPGVLNPPDPTLAPSLSPTPMALTAGLAECPDADISVAMSDPTTNAIGRDHGFWIVVY